MRIRRDASIEFLVDLTLVAFLFPEALETKSTVLMIIVTLIVILAVCRVIKSTVSIDENR